jgi:hypothetical protein
MREPLNQQIAQGRRERRSRRISGGDHEEHAASRPLSQERLLFVDAMLNGSRSLVVIPDMIEGDARDRPKCCGLPS